MGCIMYVRDMLGRMLVGALVGAAALAADATCPQVKSEPLDDGSVMRVVHHEPQPLTAYLIEIVDYPGNRFAHMEDELFRTSIPSGVEKRIVVATLMPGTVPEYLKVTAAIYADGRTCGPPSKLKLILAPRREKLQFTRALIEQIEKSAAGGASTDRLMADLNERRRSISAGSSGVVAHITNLLKNGSSSDDILGALRLVERTLATSKPAL